VHRYDSGIGAFAAALVVTTAILLAGCSSGGGLSTLSSTSASSSASPSPSPSPLPSSTTPAPAPAPPPEPAPPAPPPVDALTGGAVNDGPVIAAKIDNTSSGIPHFGVTAADIVYVEQVEGGLTRLLGVFHTNLPTEVGAIRSVRTTDAELLPTFGIPALAFSGGGGVPLDAIHSTSTVAVEQEAGAGGFWRSNVASEPYNLHANLEQIVASTPGLSPARNIGFTFIAADPRVDAGPAASSLAVQFQAARVEFAFQDGTYHLQGRGSDDAVGGQIVTDNVVFQNIDFQPDGEYDSVGSPSYISHTVGSGSFTLFRDGHAVQGTWSRPAPDQPTQFLDAAGSPVPFKPGKTWVALVPSSASTEYS
jgi:hypothetical protein